MVVLVVVQGVDSVATNLATLEKAMEVRYAELARLQEMDAPSRAQRYHEWKRVCASSPSSS
jgi:hypothetical protein